MRASKRKTMRSLPTAKKKKHLPVLASASGSAVARTKARARRKVGTTATGIRNTGRSEASTASGSMSPEAVVNLGSLAVCLASVRVVSLYL